jgi:hypothetical protein
LPKKPASSPPAPDLPPVALPDLALRLAFGSLELEQADALAAAISKHKQ